MTLGKGLGGGVPIAAILASEQAACFGPGDHGSTFGGNPLCCAVALAVFRYILEHNLSDNAARVGAHFRAQLLAMQERSAVIAEVRGRGLLLGLEFTEPIALRLVQACRELGLLVNPLPPRTIRFMPPLIIGKREVDRAVAILEAALGRIGPPTPG